MNRSIITGQRLAAVFLLAGRAAVSDAGGPGGGNAGPAGANGAGAGAQLTSRGDSFIYKEQ